MHKDRDRLTGLPTRHCFIETLNHQFGCSEQASPALILIDLDRFKSVNHGFGHDVGDALLRLVAQRLVVLAKGATLLARVSDDGFGILLHEAGDALVIGERVLEFVSRPYAVQGHSVTLSASIGVALAPHDGIDASSLLHSADLALHQAEQDGGSRLRRFEPMMKISAMHRRSLEADLRTALVMQQVELRRALVSEQFEVHYQPQLGLADRRLTGFEALLRWRHPARGPVSPAEFIPIAEEIGLVGLLGDWVLRVACRDAAQWPVPRGGNPLRVAVNVSPLQLRDGNALLEAVRFALEESHLAAGRLEIEVTETALAFDAAGILLAIKRLGCELALDDFGTGYSSLGRLRDLPFDRIKIDRSFMQHLNKNTPERARRSALWMLRAIASLGNGLGLATIAEGIETEQQATLAFDAGCTEMQGFLVSRAMPADKIAGFIAHLDKAEEKSGMPEQLHTLSYFSRNAIDTHDLVKLSHEIEAILTSSRKSNAQRGVTGALLYSAGNFAQVLEGPVQEVEAIFERIQLDPRHRDVKLLQFHPVERRSFPDWSMAFAGINPDAPERARIDEALADPGKIVAAPEGLDLIAALRDLMARHETHKV